MKKIECIILDWAGTAVDYGCFAPVAAFIESFNEIGVPVTAAETRAYMGLTKIEEIRALFNIDRVKAAFREKFGRDYTDEDVQARYVAFQRVLFDTLENYSEPIPGVVDTVEALRKAGIKIGSTTGYTDKMMDIVIPAAEKAGYKVDNCVTSDHLPAGRPYPYMVYRNMIDCRPVGGLRVEVRRHDSRHQRRRERQSVDRGCGYGKQRTGSHAGRGRSHVGR